MKVIAHQATGVHLPARFLARLAQRLQRIVPVHIIQKALLAAVAPAHDMIHGSGVYKPQLPWHETTTTVSQLTLSLQYRTHIWVTPFSLFHNVEYGDPPFALRATWCPAPLIRVSAAMGMGAPSLTSPAEQSRESAIQPTPMNVVWSLRELISRLF